MKKILLFAAAALTMTVGCQKIQELINPDKGQQPVDDNIPVEITFNTNVSANLQTKGSGAVEDFDSNQKLFIYGLNVTSGTKEIANQEAKATVAASENGETSGALTWADPAFAQFYNGTTDVYEFYGYHVDDADVTTEFSETNYVSVITIDGTQDIMLAKATPENDLPATGDWKDTYGAGVDSEALTQDQKDARAKVYSAWSARRGVTPTLKFEHKLSKLTFSVVNRGSDNLTLQGLDVNTVVDGTLTVVSKSAELNDGTALTQGLVKGSTLDYLTLDMEDVTLTPKTIADATGGADGKPVDGYYTALKNGTDNTKLATMMVFPGTAKEYEVVLNLTQAGMTTPRYVTVRINEELLEGTAYELQITLYSLSNITINAALVEWAEGKSIGIDTEDGSADESETNPNT